MERDRGEIEVAVGVEVFDFHAEYPEHGVKVSFLETQFSLVEVDANTLVALEGIVGIGVAVVAVSGDDVHAPVVVHIAQFEGSVAE